MNHKDLEHMMTLAGIGAADAVLAVASGHALTNSIVTGLRAGRAKILRVQGTAEAAMEILRKTLRKRFGGETAAALVYDGTMDCPDGVARDAICIEVFHRKLEGGIAVGFPYRSNSSPEGLAFFELVLVGVEKKARAEALRIIAEVVARREGVNEVMNAHYVRYSD